MLVHSVPSIANMNTFWNRPWYNLFLPNGTATSLVPRASPTRLTMGYHQSEWEWQQAQYWGWALPGSPWVTPKPNGNGNKPGWYQRWALLGLPSSKVERTCSPTRLPHCVPRWNRSYWAHFIVQNPKGMNSLEEWTHETLQLHLFSELQKTIGIFNSMELKSTHCSTQTQLIIHPSFN
jgi:hypothetical protein